MHCLRLLPFIVRVARGPICPAPPTTHASIWNSGLSELIHSMHGWCRPTGVGVGVVAVCGTGPGALTGAAARAVAIVALSAVVGCQSYEPKPLDLAAHREAWLRQTPGDEPVREFAAGLRQGASDGPFDPGDGLSLSEAEVVALVLNPSLRLARLEAGVSAATAKYAGLWDDPQLAIDFLSSGGSSGEPFPVTPGLAFTIPVSGRLEAAKAEADAALAATLTAVAEQEWAVRIAVRRAWCRWSASTIRMEQIQALLGMIDPLVASTAALTEVGEMVRTESALFAIERASQQVALRRATGEAGEREQELRTLLGLSPAAPIELIPTLAIDVAEDAATLDAMAAGNMELARLRDEYIVAERALALEIRKQYPDVTIGPLLEFDRGDTLAGFSVALPVPILNANQQGIAEAHAKRELARAAFESSFTTLAGALEVAMVRTRSERAQREVIELEIAPLVDAQLADARALLSLGESGALVLLESLKRVAETQLNLVEARLGESLASVESASILGPTEPDRTEPTP